MDLSHGLKGQSFCEMARLHRLLEEIFTCHQQALITYDGPAAHKHFTAYRSLLALHIFHEDEILLPVFRRIGEIKRWPAELFSGEHRKLEAFLTRIEASLIELGDPTHQNARAIIRLLDLENGLKRLQEHHDEREQQCLFLVLDQVTTHEERHQLLTRIFGEFFEELENQLGPRASQVIQAVTSP